MHKRKHSMWTRIEDGGEYHLYPLPREESGEVLFLCNLSANLATLKYPDLWQWGSLPIQLTPMVCRECLRVAKLLEN